MPCWRTSPKRGIKLARLQNESQYINLTGTPHKKNVGPKVWNNNVQPPRTKMWGKKMVQPNIQYTMDPNRLWPSVGPHRWFVCHSPPLPAAPQATCQRQTGAKSADVWWGFTRFSHLSFTNITYFRNQRLPKRCCWKASKGLLYKEPCF